MSLNPLLEELKKLRESSKYAVAQGTYSNLNGFKKYLHLERDVEKKLKNIIIKASESDKGQLLLVCGNVGDGKSHILSHLHDELESIISQFTIHNDATESHNPNESSNITLYKLLKEFKDENIGSSKDKIILAINLGTLSKFIEEYGHEFKTLKDYISATKILDTDLIHDDEFETKSNFHHVNFTDYHMYSLTEHGAISKIISTLLEKIVANNEANTIYKAYLDYKAICQDKVYCPIQYNYEFLFNENNRTIISQLIVKAIITNKEIVSLRTLLNFVHDIIVPIDLSTIKEADYFKTIEKMHGAKYISNLIPNYLFEHPELSSLFEKIESLDPCMSRAAVTDDILLTLINTENPLDIFSKHITKNYLEKIESKLNKSIISKSDLSRFFMRLNYFDNYFKKDYLKDIDFDEYLVWLYHYNNHNKDYIKKIYELVAHAARNWNGDPKTNGKVIINVGKKQTQYRVFKDFEVIPNVNFVKEKKDTHIDKFTQEFSLSFKIDNENDTIKIHVDFSLFKILKMISKGYRPNKKDNNNYVYFVNSVNILINQNNNKAPLYIDEVNIGKAVDYKFSKDTFSGYKFQVI
ncbi:DNA phosphorothioation-dependent restriction protein DptF [Flavobacterium cheongpyeongense]|uniref:DNA phosphorothioation-dependent restriction protein DptF n=1 Tax=Flavobacterium cheongpyeongense TaxID=2212651 RepID=A0A2V4C318_9FLAO|nr:DNA phosphorothioation-dependent restriction protein DptF [Flavobacterium cheongpyeongense]PXY40604.1 DNA phosphorothioation-dependent restriction protein DptF [Flavobacterium cheongpyeongense]